MRADQTKSEATCRSCGRQLTLAEFRACRGRGHYCADHLVTGSPKTKKTPPTRKRRAPRSAPTRRGRRTCPAGAAEYVCKAQFAGDGAIRRGKLTADHPASFDGNMVFVCKNMAYGPREIATLFIPDPEGRVLAQQAGFDCHD